MRAGLLVMLAAMPALGDPLVPVFGDDFELDSLERWSAVAPACTELEDNGTLATANPYCRPFFADVTPAADQDWVRIHVGSRFASIQAETVDGLATTCASNNIDSLVSIYTASAALLVSNDDTGAGFCSLAFAAAAHKNSSSFVAVQASTFSPGATFDYGLAITLVDLPCQEVEPNDLIGDAATYCGPWYGGIDSEPDVDIVQVVLGSTATIVAATADLGDGACTANALDSRLRLLDSNGTELSENDDSGPGFCSLLTSLPLIPGTYYVEVSSSTFAPAATFDYRLDITIQ